MAPIACARSGTCSASARSAFARFKTAPWKNFGPPRNASAGNQASCLAKPASTERAPGANKTDPRGSVFLRRVPGPCLNLLALARRGQPKGGHDQQRKHDVDRVQDIII